MSWDKQAQATKFTVAWQQTVGRQHTQSINHQTLLIFFSFKQQARKQNNAVQPNQVASIKRTLKTLYFGAKKDVVVVAKSSLCCCWFFKSDLIEFDQSQKWWKKCQQRENLSFEQKQEASASLVRLLGERQANNNGHSWRPTQHTHNIQLTLARKTQWMIR